MTSNKKVAQRRRREDALRIVLYFAVVFSFFVSACGSAEKAAVNNAQTNAASPTPEKKLDDFEERLSAVRMADFDYIFVFRRNDGDVLSSEDKKFLVDNMPREVNRRDLTADGKAVIAGSNFKFPPENLETLKKRFNVEGYSPAAVSEVAAANSNGGNSNANSKANSKTNSKTNSNGVK